MNRASTYKPLQDMHGTRRNKEAVATARNGGQSGTHQSIRLLLRENERGPVLLSVRIHHSRRVVLNDVEVEGESIVTEHGAKVKAALPDRFKLANVRGRHDTDLKKSAASQRYGLRGEGYQVTSTSSDKMASSALPTFDSDMLLEEEAVFGHQGRFVVWKPELVSNREIHGTAWICSHCLRDNCWIVTTEEAEAIARDGGSPSDSICICACHELAAEHTELPLRFYTEEEFMTGVLDERYDREEEDDPEWIYSSQSSDSTDGSGASIDFL